MKSKKYKFTDENGDFLPSIPVKNGMYTAKYFEELLEWLYLNEDRSLEERLKDILNIEEIYADSLKEKFGFGYIPTWSVKIKKRQSGK